MLEPTRRSPEGIPGRIKAGLWLGLSVYLFLGMSFFVAFLMVVSFVVTLPMGMRRAKIVCSTVASYWSYAVVYWANVCKPADFVVTVDPDGLFKAGLSDTLAQIAIVFGLGSGRIDRDNDVHVNAEVLMANHQVYGDWLYLWAFEQHMDRASFLKIVLKQSIQYIPIIGWALKALGFVFVKRNWAQDQLKFGKRIRRLGSYGTSYNLLIFPEGTTFTLHAQAKGQMYAKEHALPVLKHVLLPRSTGMYHALLALKENDGSCVPVRGVLDLTFGYSEMPADAVPEEYYTLKGLFSATSAPSQIHVNAAYIPIEEIPLESKEEFTGWIAERFRRKDELLQAFYCSGRFPGLSSQPVPLAMKGGGTFFVTLVATMHVFGAFCIYLIHRLLA